MNYINNIVYILRVFVDMHGNFGNPVGVVIDEEREFDNNKRQALTIKTGFSEVVFVNNLKSNNVSIYNPIHEIKFAGHAMIGTAWLMSKLKRHPIKSIDCLGGRIKIWQTGQITWLRANLSIMPPWNYEELASAKDVEKILVSDTFNKKHTYVWAWINKEKGFLQARTFAPDWNIPEDEANGSGSMVLAVMLNRNLVIHHGKGSIINSQPSKSGYSEVGGLVKLVEEKNL